MWVKERTILAPVRNFLKMAFWRCHFISFSLPMTRNLIGMRWRRNCQNRLNWRLGLQHFELHISSVGIFKLCCFVCACRDIPGVPSLRLLIFKKHFKFFKLSCDIFGEINTFILFLELLFNTFHSLPSKPLLLEPLCRIKVLSEPKYFFICVLWELRIGEWLSIYVRPSYVRLIQELAYHDQLRSSLPN